MYIATIYEHILHLPFSKLKVIITKIIYVNELSKKSSLCLDYVFDSIFK